MAGGREPEQDPDQDERGTYREPGTPHDSYCRAGAGIGVEESTVRYGIGCALTGSRSWRVAYVPVTWSQSFPLSPSGTVPASPTLTGWASAAQQVITIRVRYHVPPSPGRTKPDSVTRRPPIDFPWSKTAR